MSVLNREKLILWILKSRYYFSSRCKVFEIMILKKIAVCVFYSRDLMQNLLNRGIKLTRIK